MNQTPLDQQQFQKNLNSRLDRLYFKKMSASDFESSTPHSSKQITFVERNGAVELWKGDTRIFVGGDTDYYILKADRFS